MNIGTIDQSDRNARVFLIDDDDDLRHAVIQSLTLDGYSVEDFASADAFLEQFRRDSPGVVISDIRMPGTTGLTLLERVLSIDPAMPVVLVTGHGDVPIAVEAMRSGAYDFLEKPFQHERLSSLLRHALDRRRLALENRVLRDQLSAAEGLEGRLVGRHPAIVHLRDQIAHIAPTDADVLIHGETGAGKEVVARALHDLSGRSNQPFVALNCGALPAEMIESELFGHEKGAFTGALARRIGKFEHASGGTVFLDEIESMPLDAQVKLLRVLETRTVERLGSNTSKSVDIRVVAATKSDLSTLQTFRPDLYYRLNVIALALPPLRHRKSDIPVLFMHLAREARARFRKDIPQLTPADSLALETHDWPGNVRELRNVADRFVLGMGLGLGPDIAGHGGAPSVGPTQTLPHAMEHAERQFITAALNANDGKMKPTYEALGISRKSLYEKCRKYGLGGE